MVEAIAETDDQMLERTCRAKRSPTRS